MNCLKAEMIAKSIRTLKRSKSIDMRYHCLRKCCVEFNEFGTIWDAGKSITQSIEDFLTKALIAPYTAAMLKYFVEECGPTIGKAVRARMARA